MGDVVLLETREQREFKKFFAETYNNMPLREKKRFLANVFLYADNDRKLANAFCKQELNDIEYQQFKRFFRKFL